MGVYGVMGPIYILLPIMIILLMPDYFRSWCCVETLRNIDKTNWLVHVQLKTGGDLAQTAAVIRRFLKASSEGAPTAVFGSWFQAVIVAGKKEYL